MSKPEYDFLATPEQQEVPDKEQLECVFKKCCKKYKKPGKKRCKSCVKLR